MSESYEAILFFDGECGLCSRSVLFLMQRDRMRQLHYAPLQGDTALKFLEEHHRKELSSAVYLRKLDNQIFVRSDAIFHALIDIRSGWRHLAKIALLLPKNFRDAIYNWIARNRHSLAYSKACALPSTDVSAQILP
ncbi:MAG: DUF393 domain-containing protein [Verrucomicrobiota bacterium]